jgi:transketolase
MRDVFVSTLSDIARHDPRVVLMTGDLGFGVLTEFAREFPRQYINVGVAEQNLAGLATGLALSGHVVFTYSIANFPTLRCLEQIRNDACYHEAPVKVVAIGAGFSYGVLGISHHATEDLTIMRALPEMTVLSPGDLYEAAEATRAAASLPGPCYLRLDKSAAPETTVETAIVRSRPRRLRRGNGTIAILGTGGILEEALRAAEALAHEGHECDVFSVHTLTGLDAGWIGELASSAMLLVTLEEHTLRGGLASTILEGCADAGVWPAALVRFGLDARFSSIVGSQGYLRQRYGLDAASIAAGIREAVMRPAFRRMLEPI